MLKSRILLSFREEKCVRVTSNLVRSNFHTTGVRYVYCRYVTARVAPSTSLERRTRWGAIWYLIYPAATFPPNTRAVELFRFEKSISGLLHFRLLLCKPVYHSFRSINYISNKGFVWISVLEVGVFNAIDVGDRARSTANASPTITPERILECFAGSGEP